MGFNTSTLLADSPVMQAKVKTALVKVIDDLLPTPPNANVAALVTIILRNPGTVLEGLTRRLVTSESITLDSTDAAIETAITDSLTFMLWQTGIVTS